METEIAIIGAGPAGMSAAIEAAKAGAKVTLVDENNKPGGQLFKQIHKFFGLKEHRSGIRGYDIGNQMLEEVGKHAVDVWLDTVVYGIFEGKTLGIITGAKTEVAKAEVLKAQKVILATGASENPLAFLGWTLPGVMGAGAAQTMINIHRVLPGKKFLMVGSGNVGLIVSYQLLQAGADVIAIVEAAPEIGGYGVHAAKIRRAGVPILTSHTVKEAGGKTHVETATIVELDDRWQPVPNTENVLDVDTICVAVGLEPRTELAWMAGCEFTYIPQLGGWTPIQDENMETTMPGLYVAGDVAGVEDASTAFEEGRIAGTAATEALGYLEKVKANKLKKEIRQRLRSIRRGPFGEQRFKVKRQLIRAESGFSLPY